MTDSAKTLVWDAVYTPFGQVHSITGTATNNQRFPGQYADAETGFSYNYFRDYDPTTGRYVQSDPIGLRGGLNTYVYVEGNPLNFIDPNGKLPRPYFQNVDPPGDPTPFNDAVAEAYGDAIDPFLENPLADTSESFGNGNWANCVRGCLLEFWQPCQQEYVVGGQGGTIGFLASHAVCFTECGRASPIF